ncbi:dephospho-CoA kinase [Enterococcus hermanniensis]|uniref:Dephospho-CoA kinase n=1 Tax=Enterococcus hermanniensis TaxID=249189 RepID=A0A1L8TLE7_9ENTE|nr:dephospho-CoA kinase [Enterococcus hermanniensis]OJG44988.1 dephospho-CoA kinase [Enterococcus hermanniensis]
MSFVLGITGGIASGKSTAVKIFAENHFPIVDGDVIARKVVEPKTPGLTALIENFGPSILQKDGCLDRKKLGNLVFQDEKKRTQLNQLLDPFIRKEITQQIAAAKKTSELVIVDIPLLYEGHYEKMMDAVAVVYVTPEYQLDRLMKRNSLAPEEAQKRIDSQLSLELKKEQAQIIFDNCGSFEQLRKQVMDWLIKNQFVS